jgi:hypothetical protein
MEPRSMPKRRFLAISKSDNGCGVEQLHIIVGARVSGANPKLVGVLPF